MQCIYVKSGQADSEILAPSPPFPPPPFKIASYGPGTYVQSFLARQIQPPNYLLLTAEPPTMPFNQLKFVFHRQQPNPFQNDKF